MGNAWLFLTCHEVPQSLSKRNFKMDGIVPVSSSDDIGTQKTALIPKMSFASVCIPFLS